MNINRNDVMWGYVSLLLVQCINIILLPFIIKFLDTKEIGLWYTFTTFYMLAILIDFGFQTVISRNVSYLWAGAEKITKDSIAISGTSEEDDIDLNYFSSFLKTSKTIYKVMSIIVLIVLSTVGSYYIYTVSKGVVSSDIALTAWVIYLMSIICNIYFSYWNAFIRGIGAIKKYNQILIITKLAQLILTILFLNIGFSLIGVSLAYFISVIINRLLQGKAFYSHDQKTREIKSLTKKAKTDLNIFKNLLPNTTKTAAISFSNYLIINFPILLSSYFLSLEEAGEFGFLNQIITLILAISNSYYNTYLSKVNYLKAKNEIYQASIVFKKSIFMNVIINVCAFSIIIVLGNKILMLVGSNIYFPGIIIILISIFYRYFYNNQMLFTTYISTSNNLYYYKYIFTSALITVVIQLISLSISSNILSIVLPILIIQLMFNNWYWVYKVIVQIKKENY